jgi:hypothetical protein
VIEDLDLLVEVDEEVTGKVHGDAHFVTSPNDARVRRPLPGAHREVSKDTEPLR